jgi:hypothetical protein
LPNASQVSCHAHNFISKEKKQVRTISALKSKSTSLQ